jgi:hypothetical protein
MVLCNLDALLLFTSRYCLVVSRMIGSLNVYIISVIVGVRLKKNRCKKFHYLGRSLRFGKILLYFSKILFLPSLRLEKNESVFPKMRKEKTSLVFFLNRTFDKIQIEPP